MIQNKCRYNHRLSSTFGIAPGALCCMCDTVSYHTVSCETISSRGSLQPFEAGFCPGRFRTPSWGMGRSGPFGGVPKSLDSFLLLLPSMPLALLPGSAGVPPASSIPGSKAPATDSVPHCSCGHKFVAPGFTAAGSRIASSVRILTPRFLVLSRYLSISLLLTGT